MFKIEEIIKATNGQLIQGPDSGSILSVCIDSRRVTKDEVFIAIKGDVFDGHDFLADVLARGVKVIVLHKMLLIKNPNITVILVKDTVLALGHIARFHRLRFKTPLISLTGSAGKTTTKEMIAAVLEQKYRVLKSEGTQNNHIGVPLTLLKINKTHQIVVIECGTNQPGDIAWLSEITCPDVAIFTNIGHSHLEKLKTPSGVLKEKWNLTSHMNAKGIIIINEDDPLLCAKIKIHKNLRIMSYGVKNKPRFRATDVHIKNGLSLVFKIDSKNFELNTCAINNVYNALAAYACGNIFKVPIQKIVQALKTFHFPKGRGQIVKLGAGWLINDSYNANPTSMLSAIEMLRALKSNGKKIMIAADMLELGKKARDFHSQAGLYVARSGIDALITVGALSRHMAARARKTNRNMSVFACADIESAQKNLAKILTNGDSVLVKGSRRMAMERVVDFMLQSPNTSHQ